MPTPAIIVTNVSKVFEIGGGGALSLSESLAGIFSGGNTKEKFTALNDISFEVETGEVLGIIGKNGAGKSTLLKILSRITEPTAGRIEINGRVASLLEVGTGFHPELNGRENIFLNGAILGMSRQEIRNKFDEIVAFSGVEKFIDTPVKHYSSGMYVRLAFAVAAHLEPEILIIDEVLAVGDAEFQKKCLGKMKDVAGQGRTILFVSHNISVIQSLCKKGLLLSDGKMTEYGDINIVANKYFKSSLSLISDIKDLTAITSRKGSGKIIFSNFRILDPETNEVINGVYSGKDITFELAVKPMYDNIEKADIYVGIQIFSSNGGFITALNSFVEGKFFNIDNQCKVRCRVNKIPLMPGTYFCNLVLHFNRDLSDHIEDQITIDILAGDFYNTGVDNSYGRQGVYFNQSWSLLN